MDATEVIDDIVKGNVDEDMAIQSDQDEDLALQVQRLFKDAWDAKQQLMLNQLWRKCDDYKQGLQNPKTAPDHPGSVTNVIHRIIESQIADLVDKPYSSAAKGYEPGDDMFAVQAQNLIDFTLNNNRFKEKINVSEHDRLELGTTIVKVWFDDDGLNGKGLPVFEPVSPANIYPDPKVHKSYDLQQSEFIIHATPKPLSWFRDTFKRGKYVQRQVAIPYNPQEVFTSDRADEVHVDTSQKALLLECYMRDEEGELFCVHVANNILLEDSRKTKKGKLQRRDQYPFVFINCYNRRGTIWGSGDVELLIPTQDLINDLDDQIRINARMMGNPQIVYGIGAGKDFDARKWTNRPGLRIPMRDHNSFRIVEAVPVSRDVPVRREKAFSEADLIAGVPDVTRGQNPTGVTAASAITALQQAGQKTVIHKNEMFKAGWSVVLELLFDEILMNWEEEMWIRIDGEKPDYKFINPAELRSVPRMIPNELFGQVDGEDSIKTLQDEDGKDMKRDAMFEFQLNLGNGFPNDRSFMLQMLTDFTKVNFPDGPAVTRSELRRFLIEQVGIDLDDEREVAEQQAEQQALQQQAPPIDPMQQMPPMPPQIPQIGAMTLG